MCLSYDLEDTEAVKKRLKKNGFIWGYKTYYPEKTPDNTKYLESCYRHARVYGPGTVRSSRKKKIVGRREKVTGINTGIHVFTNKQAIINCEGCIGLVIRVKCHAKDFVAAGQYEGFRNAVFMKVEITKKDWDDFWKRNSD